MQRSAWLGLFLFAAPLSAIDRVVDRNNPAAYPHLQAALDAASPGDRILLRTFDSGPPLSQSPTTVTKSVTIRGEGGGIVVMGRPALVIRSLTPGIPLVLEDLDIDCLMTSTDDRFALRSNGVPIAGEMILDGVHVLVRPSAYDVFAALLLDVDRVSIKNSRIEVGDTADNNACCEEPYGRGGDALRFYGSDLYLENTTLRAGSANLQLYYPNCLALCPDGARGGAAILSNAQTTVLVRTACADGNGGSVQPHANWPRTPTPGSPGVSQFVRGGGLFVAYASSLQLGLADFGGPNRPRGATSSLGSVIAALSSDSPRLGQPLTLTVAPEPTSMSLALLLGTGRQTSATPLGHLHIPGNQLAALVPFPAPGQLLLTVPNNVALIGLGVIAQHAHALLSNPGAPLLGNPTTSWIRQ